MTGRLMCAGHVVFSPVAHSHPVAQSVKEMPKDHEFWMRQDLSFLRDWAEELWVLTLPGWETSRGVREEIAVAEEQGLTVRYSEPLGWMKGVRPGA